MNETRKVVFAGAGFASDEERGGGSGDFFREIEQAARSGVFGNPGEAVGHGSIVARVPNHGVRGLADVAEEATNTALTRLLLIVASMESKDRSGRGLVINDSTADK